MPTWSIRPFEMKDQPAVLEISPRLTEGFAPWRVPERVDSTVRGWVEKAIADHDEDGDFLVVAESQDGEIVGFLGAHVQDHYISGRDAYVGEVAVAHSDEGAGVGRALLDAAEAWARSMGCERFTLQTGAANTRAREFYRRLGFVEEDVSLAKELDAGTTA